MLVYFGYPQAHEDDAERAVRAGLELIQAVGELKSSAHLQTRVGIATGIVVVGDRPPNASELAINFKRRELEETCRKLDGLIEAIADGFRAPGLQAGPLYRRNALGRSSVVRATHLRIGIFVCPPKKSSKWVGKPAR